MSRELSDIEYEIYVLASVAAAATEAIVTSTQMDDEEFATQYLYEKRDVIKLLMRGERRRSS